MKKQKTAVEWLYEQHERILIEGGTFKEWNKCCEQALELEKQQIVNAWFSGYLNGEIKAELKSEEYYNENFKPSTNDNI